MHGQVVLPAYFHIFVQSMAIRKKVQRLNDRPIGRIFERDDGVVGFLLLHSSERIGEGNMRQQFGRYLAKGLGSSLGQASETRSPLTCCGEEWKFAT